MPSNSVLPHFNHLNSKRIASPSILTVFLWLTLMKKLCTSNPSSLCLFLSQSLPLCYRWAYICTKHLYAFKHPLGSIDGAVYLFICSTLICSLVTDSIDYRPFMLLLGYKLLLFLSSLTFSHKWVFCLFGGRQCFFFSSSSFFLQ